MGGNSAAEKPARFSAAFYLRQYPDVAAAGVDPETHYRQFGRDEGRFPNWWAKWETLLRYLFGGVDERFYFRVYPDVAQSGLTARDHYKRFGHAEGRYRAQVAASLDIGITRHFVFSQKFYLKEHAGLAEALPKHGLTPLTHYIHHGRREGLHPNRMAKWGVMLRYLFAGVDERFYFRTYRDAAESGLTAAEHYRYVGRAEGRFRAEVAVGMSTLIALFHFFDRDFYLAEYPDLAKALPEYRLTPFAHYARHGRWAGLHPHKLAKRLASVCSFLDRVFGGGAKEEDAEEALARGRRLFAAAERGKLFRVRLEAFANRRAARRRTKGAVSGLYRIRRLPGEIDAKDVLPIEAASIHIFREPSVIGENVERPMREVAIPPKWIATVDDAAIIGSFQVVRGSELILYEPAADPHLGFVAGCWMYVAGVAGHKNCAALHYEYRAEAHLAEGILVSGRCSPNYYHWMIEYLGKAYALTKAAHLRGVPLIVDADMFPQEFESLEAALPGWPIYKLEKNILLRVDKLHLPSTPNFLPDSVFIPFWQGAGVDRRSVEFLRDLGLRWAGVNDDIKPHRRIYLSRRKGRMVVNGDEVERVLSAEFDFEVVDTADLSFAEQVRVFAESRVIVGQMGAAFTNLIFCMPGTKVLAFASPYATDFALQGNLAAFAEASYAILPGIHPKHGRDLSVDRSMSLLFESVVIDPNELRSALVDEMGLAPRRTEPGRPVETKTEKRCPAASSD